MQSTSSQNFYDNRTSTDILQYPNYWNVTKNVSKIVEEFGHIEPGTRLKDNIESIMGRIMLKRSSGKKLYFYTILVNDILFQVMSDLRSFDSEEEFYKLHGNTYRGDIVGVKGYIAKTRKGELSIIPSGFHCGGKPLFSL